MSSIYSIYKATNTIDGKAYIGFDSNWPKRQTDHKREYQKQNHNTKFYNAIRKYGWYNFEWQVIYQSKDGVHCLNTMETYFINQYNSLQDGYNMTIGGNRGPVLHGELNGMFGKTHSNEVCKSASKRATERFKGKTYEELYGQEKSNELKKIRSVAGKNKDNAGKNNPRYDHKVYTFKNIKTNEIFMGDRFSFHEQYNISKPSICEIVKKRITRRNWIIL